MTDPFPDPEPEIPPGGISTRMYFQTAVDIPAEEMCRITATGAVVINWPVVERIADQDHRLLTGMEATLCAMAKCMVAARDIGEWTTAPRGERVARRHQGLGG